MSKHRHKSKHEDHYKDFDIWNKTLYSDKKELKKENYVLIEKTISGFKIIEFLGKGNFAEVYKAVDQNSGEFVAIKVLDRYSVTTEDNSKEKKFIDNAAMIQKEISIQLLMDHPHIVKVKQVIKDNVDYTDKIFLVLEYLDGGELFDYIVAHQQLSENRARKYFRQIVSALEYCHAHLVIHHDLKCENLLLTNNRDSVKISDFGLSSMINPGEYMTQYCGSVLYAAPEIISKKIYRGPEVDIWSLGVILFTFVTGCIPWDGSNDLEHMQSIIYDPITIPNYVSKTCGDLILQMLDKNPITRITIEGIKRHFWTNVGYDKEPPSYFKQQPTFENLKTLDSNIIAQIESIYYKQKLTDEHKKQILNNENTAVSVTYRLLVAKAIKERELEITENKICIGEELNQVGLPLDIILVVFITTFISIIS